MVQPKVDEVVDGGLLAHACLQGLDPRARPHLCEVCELRKRLQHRRFGTCLLFELNVNVSSLILCHTTRTVPGQR